MDAENPRKRARLHATCPVCLNYFSGPVTLQCGHSFCEICIRRCLEEAAKCPQCRAKVDSDFHPSYALSSLVEVVRDWEVSAERETLAWAAECERHKQPLDLFCRDDHAPVCMECQSSQEHVGHSVVPVEEAAREYKDVIDRHLKILGTETQEISEYEAAAKDKMGLMLNELMWQKEKRQNDFRQLRDFLDREENLAMNRTDELQLELRQKEEMFMATFRKALSSRERIIQELKEKRQQPASELLQDIRNTFQRYEERESHKTLAMFPLDLAYKIWNTSDLVHFLGGTMKQFTDTVKCDFPLQEADVTLDPDTAHCKLVLSEDLQTVRWSNESQEVPDKPERFDNLVVVLGHQQFTAGRHTWVVTLADKGLYAVGVARKSVPRKGCLNLVPENGIWAIEKSGKQYSALGRHPIAMTEEPKRIQVVLNYPGQRVAFYDAERGRPIYAFSNVSFFGEALVPFCLLGEKACLTLSPECPV
ncbi:tripartite motif-containing protein 10-like [Elgaria multicarinata webbii]|uniref:tripartite motif-containing protein 10-like n=1 Tax=Elgaria multicarinata webbii TaxID=159646 RepID=UPI002FCCCE63